MFLNLLSQLESQWQSKVSFSLLFRDIEDYEELFDKIEDQKQA